MDTQSLFTGILDRLDAIYKQVERRDDINRTVGFNVSTAKPVILDYHNRNYIFIYSPNAITLTIEEYGTVTIPANTWINLNFVEGTRMYSNSTQAVLMRWTDTLLSVSNSSVNLVPNSSVNIAQVGGATYALGTNNMAHSQPTTIATDDTVMAELLLDTDNLASIKTDLDAIQTNTNKLIAPSVNQGTIDATTQRVTQGGAATGTKTNVASSASSVTILASNTSRKGATIFNDSTQVLYLDLSGGTASNASYSTQVGPGILFELPGPIIYNGAITGIWAAANGNARVTEFS